MRLTPHELGMLHMVSRDYRRIYLGRAGCELCGYASGRWWTALSLWIKGYLRQDGPLIRRGYGTPCVYLVPTEAGRLAVSRPHGETP